MDKYSSVDKSFATRQGRDASWLISDSSTDIKEALSFGFSLSQLFVRRKHERIAWGLWLDSLSRHNFIEDNTFLVGLPVAREPPAPVPKFNGQDGDQENCLGDSHNHFS
jgi:hypothetical protein